MLGLGHGLSTLATVAVSGIAILGTAFLLTWGAETVKKFVARLAGQVRDVVNQRFTTVTEPQYAD